ncbi:F-box domain-containing protein [Mycena venus]|uniref:F-box domain-containing protein n=1 Tax=Mycena venus TaxID=2733690 RepID=A0A8H6XVH6_9AGAR|nr:F-box domain-containing protein [Mycena venus]
MSNPYNSGSPRTAASYSGTRRILRDRLAEIDEEMADLQMQLGRLAAERKPIVEALQSVTYPVLALPPEITAEVFIQYVDHPHIGGTDPNIPHAPGWTPGSSPLVLASDILCAALAPYFHQIQNFSCSVDIPATFPSDLLRGRMPRLRKLWAGLNAFPEDLNGPPSTVTAFADAPELLSSSAKNTTKAVEILHSTPNLDTLSLQLVDFDGMPPASVRLIHLRTLMFHEYHQLNIDILDHITLPALEHLELSTVERSMSPRFAAFISRSGCVLRSIAFIAVQSGPVVDFLRAVPTVCEVRMKNTDWNLHSYNHFFGVIAHEPQFLPTMRSLSFNPCMEAVEIPYSDVAAMLASRWQQGRGNGDSDGGVRLESFELVIAPTLSFESIPSVAEVQQGLDALRALEADGLKINIRGLQRLTDTVDATAVCPPAHLRTIL